LLPEIRPEFGEFAAAQWTRTVLCRLLRDYLHTVRPVPGPIRVGTDVGFYYDPADRLARVTPDLYVVEGIGPEEQLRSFRTWERNRVPELVVHLIDAAISPEDGLMMHFYRLGVQDVVLYDPLWFVQPTGGPPKGRRLLWHYRRKPRGDGMQLQPLTHPGRVALPRYGLWLCHRGGADLRVYVGGPEQFPPETACWPLPEEVRAAAGS
jgi:Uma2 family endonuclease